MAMNVRRWRQPEGWGRCGGVPPVLSGGGDAGCLVIGRLPLFAQRLALPGCPGTAGNYRKGDARCAFEAGRVWTDRIGSRRNSKGPVNAKGQTSTQATKREHERVESEADSTWRMCTSSRSEATRGRVSSASPHLQAAPPVARVMPDASNGCRQRARYMGSSPRMGRLSSAVGDAVAAPADDAKGFASDPTKGGPL